MLSGPVKMADPYRHAVGKATPTSQNEAACRAHNAKTPVLSRVRLNVSKINAVGVSECFLCNSFFKCAERRRALPSAQIPFLFYILAESC